MKKNIGSQLALYPTPVTVIGVMNEDKPIWIGKCLSFKNGETV